MGSYLIPCIWSVFVEKYRTTPFVFGHQTRIPEMRDQIAPALDSAIRKRRHLFAVELFPSLAIKRLHKKFVSLQLAVNIVSLGKSKS
jgi:hypothetical protein